MEDKGLDAKIAFTSAMLEIINMLPIDWDKIDLDNPHPSPDAPVGSSDEVVGKLTDNQKTLWTVMWVVKNDLKKLENDTPATNKQNNAIKLLEEMFSFCVFNTFKKLTAFRIKDDKVIIACKKRNFCTCLRDKIFDRS